MRREPSDCDLVGEAMLYNVIRSHSRTSDLAVELERVRRIGLTLIDPDDLNIVHQYIAELEARLAQRQMEPSESFAH